ncbi:hypothetical protein WHR41_04407 [Cladosporium halotolerans]|uniref:alpha-1,2-Mannosidase n=1 Tax=Cladosporium halotolerans TaxID=1052096 RepID=A0AB34KUI9_9PEZI
MPVRRVRFLAIAVFVSIALFLFTRSTSTYENYKTYAEQKYENAVGGGSVLRPEEGEKAKQEIDQAAGPPEDEDVPAPAPAPAPEPEVTTSARIVEVVGQATESSEVAETTSTLAPTQPLPLDYQEPQLVANEDEIPIEIGQGRYEVDGSPKHSDIHWTKLPEHFPITSTIQIPTSKPSAIPKVQHKFKKSQGADANRLAVIQSVAAHAWKGYKEKAWGHDEVKPISGKHADPFNGWGATLVDGMDTLWIMGMKAEFEEAVEFVETIDFTTTPRNDIPLFETTIRYLGGLVAAYEVSGAKYRVLLDKAVELAEVLYSAFDTPNRMPETYYRWKPTFSSQPHRASTRAVLAEIGSLSMEFTRLAQLTKEPKYYDAIARVTDALGEFQNNTRLPGMWPTYVDASGCAKPAQMNRPLYGTHIEHPDGSGDLIIADEPVQGKSNANAGTAVAPGKAVNEIVKEAEEQQKSQNIDETKAFENPSEEDRWTDKKNQKRQLDAGTGSAQASDDHLDSNNAAAGSGRTADTGGEPLFQRPNNVVGQKPQTGADVCVPQGLGSPNKHGSEVFTLAGMSDSTYEYLPKMHLLLRGRIDQYKDMYLKSADVAIEKLVYRPMTKDGRDILASGDLRLAPNMTSGEQIETFRPVSSHLVCFAGGMFALGGVIFDRPEDLEVGKKLTDGCIWAYNVTATGIMPEDFMLSKCESKTSCEWNETKYFEELDPYRAHRSKTPTAVTYGHKAPSKLENTDYELQHKRQLSPDTDTDTDSKPEPSPSPSPTKTQLDPPLPKLPALHAVYTPPPPLSHEEYVAQKIADERLPPGFTAINSNNYILRPEAIESVFYLYRITGEQYWRDRGWEMFTAIQDHTGAVFGNSAIDDVTKAAPEAKDSEESFWLAETLKYFYLLFDEPEKWSLDDWVLNTEAHFFKRT